METLLFLSDRAERLGGKRLYKLHLEAADRWRKRGADRVAIAAGDTQIWFRILSAKAIRRAETLLTKEPGTIAWIDGFSSDDVLWDIGANVGVYTLYAAKVKGVRTLAFEPASFNHSLLCENIRINNLGQSVGAYALAFSNRTEIGALFFADDMPGAAFATLEGGGRASHQEATLVFTVDDFVGRFEPPFPTHIKIDVDGLEEHVLAGATNTLRDPRLRSLSIEVDEDDPERPARVDAVLEAAGFRFLEAERSPLAPHSHSRNRLYGRTRGQP